MILSVQVNRKILRLEIQTADGGVLFRAGSEPERQAQILQVQPGIFSVLLAGRSYEAGVEHTDGQVRVTIHGWRFEVRIVDPRVWTGNAARAQSGGRESISALMPGKIVRLLVSPGEQIAAGQALLVIEAMKMQNEMKAGRAGRVVSIGVREGDTVAAGAVLAIIE